VLAAHYAGNRTMTVDEADPAPPGPGEVQIAVAYNGICGTDLHILAGHMDARVDVPAVIGHEMSGTVAALGDGVEGWAVGDPVTVMPLAWDGTCPACLAGNSHICQNLDFVGIDSPGALQRRWNVDAGLLVPLPATLSLQHAALVEPTAVAVHDVRRAELEPGQKAVVIGGGPIGVLIAAVARSFGADVVVVELDPKRRSQVADLGFTALDPRDDTVAAVEEWTGGAGVAVVVEHVGEATWKHSLRAPRPGGTLVVSGSTSGPNPPADLQRVFFLQLNVIGSTMGTRGELQQLARLCETSGIRPQIDRVLALSEARDGFAALDAGDVFGKIVFTP